METNEPKNDIEAVFGTHATPPTQKQQSFGALISIIIIVLMVVMGAYYSWSKRIAEQPVYPTDSTTPTPTEESEL